MTLPDDDLLAVDDRLDPAVRDPETPPEDAAEQAMPAYPQDVRAPVIPALPWDANEYDAVEQARDAAQDDDYR